MGRGKKRKKKFCRGKKEKTKKKGKRNSTAT